MENNSDDDFLKLLGQHFEKLRIEKKLTQADIAHICEVTPSQISRFECGKINPRICTLRKLAVGMNIPLGDLIIFNETDN